MQVVVDVEAMASRRITVPDLIRALRVENKTISAGDFDEGKRRYIARTVGEYHSPEDVANVIIRRVEGIPVAVKDVATVRLGHETPAVVVRHDGVTTIVMSAVREPGTNVLLVMDRLKSALAELNAGILKDRHLSIEQVYDETTYIYDAINLVKKNLLVGSILAVTVLLLFLRNIAGTVVVSAAIPVSVVGTFLFMTLAGRNINVVSLAGLSFAVGMVVDNSIVVFENIFRHREMGKGRIQAAFDGTTEVWGAVLASTLTTIAVFLPIVFVEEEAGQLFRDIAIAISSAVALSLLISITGIPTLCALILGRVEKKSPEKRKRMFSATRVAGGFVSALVGFVDWMCGRVWSRVAVAVALVALAVVLVVNLIPKTEYLPTGNRELLFGILIPPPGYNTDEFAAIARTVEADILPLVNRDGPSEAAEKLNLPTVKNFFYVAFRQQIFMGVISREAERTAELIPYVYRTLGKVPGMIPIVYQAGLFTRGLGSGRSIDIDLKGPDLPRLIALGRQIYGMTAAAIPGAQIRPIPGLDLGNPELRITPNRDRLTRLGISTTDLGTTVDALVGGAKAGAYRLYGDEIDLVVKSREDRLERIQDLEAFPVASPLGGKVLLGSVADIQLTEGPTQINHIDTQRAITIQVNPPADVSLEAAMETIARQVIEPVKAQAQLGSLYRIDLGGTADQLTRTRDALDLEPGPGRGHLLPADECAVRELSLPVDHPVQRAPGRRRRVPGDFSGEPVYRTPAAGYSHHAGICHPGGHRGQQRHPDRPPEPQQHPRAGHGTSPGHYRIGAFTHPAHLHEQYHHGVRHAAPGAFSRRRLRVLPGAGRRGGGWSADLHHIHHFSHPRHSQPDHGYGGSLEADDYNRA